jgi:hypothetical protein
MTRKLHDAFAKECLQELLADFGTVEVERPIAGEVRTIDVVFYPDPEGVPNLQALGLLGRMVATPCLLEPFRNPVPTWEICNCRHKGLPNDKTAHIDVWSAGFRPLGACPQTPIGGQLSPPNPLQTKPGRGSPGLALGLAKMRLIEDSLFS